MNKKKWGIAGKIVVFLLIVMVGIHVLNCLFIPKWTLPEDNRITSIIEGFYEEPENSLDIIFLGNSDVYRGVSPIYLWREYGYASYVRSTPGQKLWVSYYQLLETLKYQTPKLVVFAVDSLFNEEHSGEGNYRKTFDPMRLSAVKIQAILDPVFEFDFDTKSSYLFPFIRYHSRWNQLTEEDISFYSRDDKHFPHKGMDMSGDIKPYEGGYSYMEDRGETVAIGERAGKYMELIIELCREKGMQLLFVEIPSTDSWTLAKSQATTVYAQEKGIPFIDLNLATEDFGFDWLLHTSDNGDHLNVWGAEVVTSYLGRYLSENYELPDHRGEASYSRWEEDTLIYEADKTALELVYK